MGTLGWFARGLALDTSNLIWSLGASGSRRSSGRSYVEPPKRYGPPRPKKVAKGLQVRDCETGRWDAEAGAWAAGTEVRYGAYEYPCQYPVRVFVRDEIWWDDCGAPTKWSERYSNGVESIDDPICSVGHRNSGVDYAEKAYAAASRAQAREVRRGPPLRPDQL